MSLQEYRKKRNFKKTKEPQSGKSSRNAPIFVVQEHWASHLHYDFRLEAFGTLKSWAVPKGPSVNVGEKRLAVEVEDHPIDYAQFKGRIPEGEYGAGLVKIWDKGTWVPPNHIKEALQKGHLEFELKGKKLKGLWLLQRTQQKSGRKSQWLLIKRTDRAQPLKAKTSLQKNKLKLSPWPEDLSPQLAELVDQVPQGSQWIHEIKFDGYRSLATIKNKKVQIFTRNGLDWTKKYPAIAQALRELKVKSVILDGEIIAMDDEGHSNFSILQKALSEEKSQDLIYYVFDLLYLDGVDYRQEPLENRKQILKKVLQAAKHPQILFSEHVRGEGEALLAQSCREGQEGIIAKDRNKPYRPGRNSAWQKIKCSHRQEFVIGGYTDPAGSRIGFGALLMGVFEGDQFRYVGRVGTGFTGECIDSLLKKFAKLESTKTPFTLKNPARSSRIHWLKPQLIAEVEFKAWTHDQILRHASYLGLREDKKAKEVRLEKPTKPKAENKGTASSFHITHPDRLIYENEKITKLDVANYYQSVSPWMLKHLRNRPLSFLRCPSGAGAACFFQKHIDHSGMADVHEDAIQEQKVSFIDSPEGLLQLVQWGVLEFHTWQCHVDQDSHPDQLIFDLDPDAGLPWKKVVQGALQMKEILERLSLKSFLKTTGGKGLHLHVPLAPIYSWEQGKAFAKALSQSLVEEHPELYTTEISKQKRKGKIFLDYLRNGVGATAIAPYSLRAKGRPVVALPLAWSELQKIKGSDLFDMRAVLKRLAQQKQDPWKGYASLKQKISILP